MGGSKGHTTAKALHIRMEAKPGKEAEVEDLLMDILACVEREPATRPWFGVRLSRSVFGIFETFPNEAGRKAHLSGKGAKILMQRSNALLARPAEIDRVDVLANKPG
jgi:quinol monooxygenase YgiN